MDASSFDEIVITGFGARTSLGSATMTMPAVEAGLNRFREHPYMIDKTGEPIITAMASYLDPGLDLPGRWQALAGGALKDLALGASSLPRTCFLGLPELRPGVENTLVEEISAWLTQSWGITRVVPFNQGHAAGVGALHGARTHLNDHKGPVLVGGLDSYLSPETLEWLDETDRLKTAQHPFGFIPGEAAAFCVVDSGIPGDTHPSRIRQLALSQEEKLIYTDAVCTGEGLSQSFRQSLSQLGEGLQVSQLIGDLNGVPYRADEFGFATMRNAEKISPAMNLFTPADCWGDVGAASSLLFLGLVMRVGSPPPGRHRFHLCWTSSEGGARGSVLVDTRGGGPDAGHH